MKIKALCHSLLGSILIMGTPSISSAQGRAYWTNDALHQEPSNGPIDDPAAYFETRERALALVRAEEWVAAEPLLESLTSQYADDGDTWFLLGLTYLQTESWSGAIYAMQKALELGASIHDIPTGSPPSNDIMVRIADAFAAMGDSENAILWINRALEARYDERPFLSGTPHLQEALSEEQYLRSVGAYVAPDMSRDEAWRADLHFLAAEIERLHVNRLSAMSDDEFARRIADIETQIPSLSDQQIVFRFMGLVGAMGSGHNLILPTGATYGSFSRLPLEFYWFQDGLFVVDADEGYKEWIGYRVERIGNTSALEALGQTSSLNARDNNMQALWLAPYYVSLPELLEFQGIAESATSIELTLSGSGEVRTTTLAGEDWEFTDFPRLPRLNRDEQPLYLSNHDRLYWKEHLPDQNAIFVQFNWVQEYDEQSLEAFSRALVEEINVTGVENLILDLRLNHGGNGAILPPMLRALNYFEGARPGGKLFVIAGRGTFSAAHNLLTDIDRLTNAIIVGEPSGSRPNALSEAGWFRLPYSGLRGLISSQFHQQSAPEDHRIWIAPHVPVVMTSKQYFAGQDPAMEAIEQIISTR